MQRERERGAGKIKAVFWLLVLALFIFAAFKVVPAFVNNFQFEDAIKAESRFAVYQRRSDEEVRDIIFRKAKDVGITQVRKEDIHVQTSDGHITIRVEYTVPVEFPGYTLNLKFSPNVDNRAP